jgi:hypothetical protein
MAGTGQDCTAARKKMRVPRRSTSGAGRSTAAEENAIPAGVDTQNASALASGRPEGGQGNGGARRSLRAPVATRVRAASAVKSKPKREVEDAACTPADQCERPNLNRARLPVP